MTHAPGSDPTTRRRASGVGAAWSTPKTICRRRTMRATSRPPRSRVRLRHVRRVRRSRGFGLLNDPEPLPYVQPSDRHAVSRMGGPDGDRAGRRRRATAAAGRRGTQDLGLMMLRVGVGALLIAHGLQKAFGWWGGQGLTASRQSLADIGYQHAGILTYVAAGGQIAAGVLLVLGCSRRWRPRVRWPTWSTRCWRRRWRAHDAARLSRSSCPTGTNTRSSLVVRGRRDHPDRSRPVRIRRRSRLGPAAVHRLVRRAGARYRRRRRGVGASSTARNPLA